MFPLQIDYNMISKALSGSLETIKQSQSVPPSALEQIQLAQQQYLKAMTNHLTRTISW